LLCLSLPRLATRSTRSIFKKDTDLWEVVAHLSTRLPLAIVPDARVQQIGFGRSSALAASFGQVVDHSTRLLPR